MSGADWGGNLVTVGIMLVYLTAMMKWPRLFGEEESGSHDLDAQTAHGMARLRAVTPSPRRIAEAVGEFTSSFDPARFKTWATESYDRIVRAYMEGKVQTLESCLDEEVLETFVAEIEARHSRQEAIRVDSIVVLETEVVSIDFIENSFHATVSYSAEIRHAACHRLRPVDAECQPRVLVARDLWTFAKMPALDSRRDAPWQLIATDHICGDDRVGGCLAST